MSVTYLPSALRSSTFDPGHGLVLRDPLSGQTLGAGADIGRDHETACGRCGWWRRTCGEHYRTGVRRLNDTPVAASAGRSELQEHSVVGGVRLLREEPEP